MVFIDAQNMYRGARRAFGLEGQPGHYGNFRPIALARFLTQGSDRELVQARIYTGVPTPKNDQVGNAITQRRMAAWIADNPGLIQVFPRPLRYDGPRGREKGIDVELAIDIVRMAIDDEYDIAILASADHDLVPPLEFVHKRYPDKIIETVAWEPMPGCEADCAEPIDLPGGGAVRRTVEKKHFDRIADRRNFTRPMGQQPVVERSRWAGVLKRIGQ